MNQQFSGQSYQHELDFIRLSTLQAAVNNLMRDGEFRTLGEIQQKIGRGSEASISARLRDLRKPPYSLVVEKRRRGNPLLGLFEYRVAGCM